MPEKFTVLADRFSCHAVPIIPAAAGASAGAVSDTLARPLQDLRISLTDRCNFRCVYCMPKELFHQDYAFLPRGALLNFEEITRIARIFVACGVRKIRLTGGEPLLRKHLENLIEMLAQLKTPDGSDLDLALTTNGSLLARKAQSLRDAGLKRITVSLDSLDDATFRRVNGADFPVAQVLHGLDVAHAAGFGPIKLNMVVKRGMNDQEIVPMARHFKGTPFILRFIEYMDAGSSNDWKMEDVIPSSEVVRRVAAHMPLEAIEPNHPGETAERWRYLDGGGEIGVVSSVTQSFCRDCIRARLSTEGVLYTCLFATSGHDLRALMRSGKTDGEISAAVAHVWRERADRYSELRSTKTAPAATDRKIEMSYIGG
ncbi:MAG: GTP 3',8-cyclase MoaA [Nitrosomonadales bacterium]|nr:GTP 3',8-cyclase MoaA [Nitrosomonadales bacterium]